MYHQCRITRKIWSGILLFVVTGTFFCLSAGETNMGDLVAPSSPAFVILGISPSEVDRPAIPRAILISLADLIDKDGIPSDFSLEFAPYWWTSHPDLTFDKYQASSGFCEAAFPTLSFSIGTSRLPEDSETNLGIGVRMNLFNGMGINTNQVGDLRELVEALQTKQIETIEKLNEGNYNSELADSLENELRYLAHRISDIAAERSDFRLELASACAVNIPGDQWDSAKVDRWGAWLTASYRGYQQEEGLSPVTFLATGRYIRKLNSDNDSNIFDFGGRLIWETTVIPASLSAEYMTRLDREYDYTASFLAEYILDDNMIIYATFGKAFEDESLERNDLVTTLGVSFGCGRRISNFD